MTTDIVAEFAPTGTLRVALNHGNRILVGRDSNGTPKGISVDLANALAKDLGVDLTFVEFDRAVDVSNSAEDDVWDVCFLAVDPKRAQTIDFTDPYIRIEGRYLASVACTAETADALVASGDPVGTVEGSAYTLTLSRKPGAEHLVTFPDIHSMLAALDAGEVKAVAGIGAVMEAEAKLREGARTLQPPFMEIRQAMAIVKGRPEAANYLRHFLAELARSGRVGDILEAHGVSRDSAIVPDAA
ncbi:transporter substrate-binding domain-containing protein [Thalassospira alkalitolerans]|uniref:transporter substrate-binding domain-containing protein n=1 Tax=Thalassospira alkalitolerans TaxID=1293890 RepID=UPI003AA854F1